MAQQPEGRESMVLSSPESFKKVVEERDLDFLKAAAVASEPDECCKRLGSSVCNVFHIAAFYNNVDFIDEAMKILPPHVVQSLLCQEGDYHKENPLHVAVSEGHSKVVKLMLDYYRSSSSSSDTQSTDGSPVKKPWLGLDVNQSTPLHSGAQCGRERITLEILSMDVVLLSNMEDRWGQSPLFLAVQFGLNRVALQILTLAPNCSLSGSDGQTALFYAPCCSDQVINLLLEKAPQHIIGQGDNGVTVLHYWVVLGKLYPFEYVLNINVIDPHLRRDFIDQLSTEDIDGDNPLHVVIGSSYDDAFNVKIAQILVDAYRQERAELFLSAEFQPPWLAKNVAGNTPLHVVINAGREELASYFFSLDKVKFLLDNGNLLLLAIKHCPKLAEEILGTIQQNVCFMELLTLDNGQNALHYAPISTEPFLTKLLEKHPEFINECDDNGRSVLHSWIEIGQLWPFQHILKGDGINPQCRSKFIDLLFESDAKSNFPLHLAAVSNLQEVMLDIVKLLLDVSKSIFNIFGADMRDKNGYTPLELAISHTHEKLAMLFLSMDVILPNEVEASLLFKAVEHKCHEVVKFLLERTAQHDDREFLRSHGRNILHVMWKSKEENGRLIVEKWPELINEDDSDGKKPLEIASRMGKAWLVEMILQKDRSSILIAPLAWIEACKNGHISTVRIFVDNSSYFRYICHEQQETPLHHLQQAGYNDYQEFLKHQFIKEMKNTKNKDGETPLHRAIRSKNKDLAEVLLTGDGVDWNIKDNNNRTAKDLLREICKENVEWATMCKSIGVDPTVKTRYIKVKMDLAEMRETISLVAALLATITCTAGFTLPGGFDQTYGDAILSGKVAFSMFLITDTYAMSCSMLVLFCIIWSMVCDRNKSSALIDHSLELLKQSLYGTLLAFMAAIYTAIHKKSLGVAITVIIMCSLVIILAQRHVLYRALDMLKSLDDKTPEVKKRWVSFWERQASIIKSFFRRAVNAPNATAVENQTNQVEDGSHASSRV